MGGTTPRQRWRLLAACKPDGLTKFYWLKITPILPDVAARLLRGRGYDVVIAASIKSALTAAEGNEIDLALCDIGLPDGDGCDLMRELRAKYSMRGIAPTGYAMDDDDNRVSEAGFSSRLVKPIDFDALCRVVENVLASENPDLAGDIAFASARSASARGSRTFGRCLQPSQCRPGAPTRGFRGPFRGGGHRRHSMQTRSQKVLKLGS